MEQPESHDPLNSVNPAYSKIEVLGETMLAEDTSKIEAFREAVSPEDTSGFPTDQPTLRVMKVGEVDTAVGTLGVASL